MNYYYPNEVLYPDYNAFPQQADFSKPYQVYNLEKPVENTDYFLCKLNPSNKKSLKSFIKKRSVFFYINRCPAIAFEIRPI